ncbi:MAG: GNAT family N-acetyltransferase [Candidatus Thorarchaeota archaeon]
MVRNSVTIQLAAIEDVDDLTETCKKAFESDSDFGAPGTGGPPGYDSLEWNINKIKNNFLQYYKILEDANIVGGFIVGNRGANYQVCERVWIDPDQMRKGIGSSTFDLIWKKYPSADLWVLGTPEWNTRTNPFYQSIGFKQIGKTHEHSWDGIFYEKRITDEFPEAMSRIVNIGDGQRRVVVEGRVEKISGPRTVSSRKTGEDLKVADVTLSDDTGSIELVLWNTQIPQVKADSSIRIEEGFVKTYRDELQMSIGQWGTIITLT